MGDYIFKLPDIGEGVVEGEIVLWHVKVGDSVVEDDDIVDIMTDKATVTIPSPTSGIVTEFSGEVGDMVAVGSTLVTFATDGNTGNQVEKEPVPEEIIKPVVEEKIIQEPVKEEKTKQIPKPIRAAVTQSKQITPSNGNSRVLASPAVRLSLIHI